MKNERSDWYTIDQLSDHWKVHKDLIQYFIDREELKLSERFVHPDFVVEIDNTILPKEEWTCSPTEVDSYIDDCVHLNHLGYKSKGLFIQLKEVERFEKVYGQVITDGKVNSYTKNDLPETDIQMVERLKLEGLSNKEIAKKLKTTFPNIYPTRIGVLITEDPNNKNVSKDAYRKRGIRLLK